MSFKVIYNPEVYDDIRKAVEWYNKQQSGLGERYFTIVKKHLESLKKHASHFAVRYDDIHCMPIRKFPYMVHYRIDNAQKTIKIEAIFNTHRDPLSWFGRKPK
jgi:hypothetical protein